MPTADTVDRAVAMRARPLRRRVREPERAALREKDLDAQVDRQALRAVRVRHEGPAEFEAHRVEARAVEAAAGDEVLAHRAGAFDREPEARTARRPFDRLATVRPVRIGALSKPALLVALQQNEIALNEAALTLFAHEAFTTAERASTLDTVEVAVADLGFTQGATTGELCERAHQRGLARCPLELGPHLRLQYGEQPEGHVGHPPTRHRAPPGSVTIASAPLDGDDELPKGFYLRRIDGVLWLRGYRASADHRWSPDDRFVFVAAPRDP